MAFPTGWGRKCVITIPAAQISGSNVNFPVLVTEANLPTEMLDGGANSALNGGGDVRFSEDSVGSTQVPIDVVSFITGGTPSAEIHVKLPSVNTGADKTYYVWYKKAGEVQPLVTAAYGRNAVWSDAHYAGHMNGAAPINSADGTAGTLLNTTSDVVGKIGNAVDYGTNRSIVTHLDSNQGFTDMGSFSISSWVKWNGTANANEDTIASEYQVSKHDFLLRYDSALGKIEFYIFTSGQAGGAFNNTSIADGLWHRVDADYDGSTMRVYVDGVLSPTTYAQTGITGDAAVPENLWWGGYQNIPAGDKFRGLQDENRLWKSSRNSGWLTTEYNNQSNPAAFGIAGTPQAVGGGSSFSPFWAINSNVLIGG